MNINEILKEINGLKTKAERVERLREVSLGNDPISTIIVLGFNEWVIDKIMLPDSVAPAKQDKEDEAGLWLPAHTENYQYDLEMKTKDLPLFVDMSNGREKKNMVKIENMFIQFLESIHPDDAEMVANIMARNWPYKKITRPVVEEARPDLTRKPDWVQK